MPNLYIFIAPHVKWSTQLLPHVSMTFKNEPGKNSLESHCMNKAFLQYYSFHLKRATLLYNSLNNIFTCTLTTYVVLRCHSRLLANYTRKNPSNYHWLFLLVQERFEPDIYMTNNHAYNELRLLRRKDSLPLDTCH